MPTLAELLEEFKDTPPVADFEQRIAIIRGAGGPFPKRRDLVTIQDLIAGFDEDDPGPVEKFILALGEGAVEVGKDILDFPARSFRGMQALGEGIAVGVGLGREKLGLIPEGAGFQPTMSPEEAESRLTASAFDAVFQLGGFGLGRFGKSVILKGLPKATSRAGTAAIQAAEGAVEGVTAGLSPFFVDRNDPVSISSRLATAAEFGVFGAVTRPAVAGLTKAFTPDASKFRKTITVGLNKLDRGQFLRNIVPQARRRLVKTADTFNAAADDIMVRVDAKIVERQALLERLAQEGAPTAIGRLTLQKPIPELVQAQESGGILRLKFGPRKPMSVTDVEKIFGKKNVEVGKLSTFATPTGETTFQVTFFTAEGRVSNALAKKGLEKVGGKLDVGAGRAGVVSRLKGLDTPLIRLGAKTPRVRQPSGGPRLRGAALAAFTRRTVEQEMKLVGPELKQVLLEELEYVAAVDRRFIQLLAGPLKGKARQLKRQELSRQLKKPISQIKLGFEGFNIETFRRLVANNNRLRGALKDGQLRFDSLNHIRGVANELNAFALESIQALSSLTSPSPLRTLQTAFSRPFTFKKNARPIILSLRNNLFGYLSFFQDSIGNSANLTLDIASRGVADATDVLLGRAANATRLASVYNSVRNKKLVDAFAKANTKGIFVSGEVIGRDPGLSLGGRVLENVLFGGLKGKGVADTIFRRQAVRTFLFDEAFKASRKAGVGGVERELFVRNFLADLPATTQSKAIEFGNRAAFIVPRSATFTQVADHPAIQLFASPFVRFGAAWAEFLAEFVPIFGTIQTARRGAALGLSQLDVLTQAVTRQLAGAGTVLAVDRLLYDNLDFTGFGIKYVDPSSGRQTILPSPLTDAILLTALVKGDFEKASAALEVSGLTFLGGGLLGPLPLALFQPTRITGQRLTRESERVFQNLFPGKAMFAIINDLMTDHREEPFTEEGTFIPGLTLFPGITGRARLRPGGEESSLKKLMFTDLDVPRSFGSIVTVKDLNATERFLEFVRRRTDRAPRLTQFPESIELRTRGGDGVVVDNDLLDDRVKRFYIRKRGEYFALMVAGLDNDPFFRALSPELLEERLDYYLGMASSSAKGKTEATFARTLTAVGEI